MFIDSLDIANRACQHLGVDRIDTPTEDSKNNAEMTFAYDKLRRAELRRNTWRFAIKRAPLRPIDNTCFLLTPAQYNSGIQYLPGSIVADANGYLWVSNVANNIANDPNFTDVWDGYYGTLTVVPYDTTGGTSYYAGDLVYIPNSDSSYNIYLSTQNSNTEVPNVADVYSSTVIYNQDATVSYGGQQWRSLIALNLNNTPANGPANWSSTQTYSYGSEATGSDGFIYSSNINNNLSIDPVADSGVNWFNRGTPNAWTTSPVIPVSSRLWTPIYASMQSFNFVYPIGVGPASQPYTKNIFRLPANFLRQAPQDPKAGLNSFLGAPAWNAQPDWELEGDFLISECSTPLLFRFVADVVKVSEMDDMFCEGLACRVGLETCETLTNSNAKKQTMNNDYTKFMGEARIVNAIETGPVMPPEDEYIICRQ